VTLTPYDIDLDRTPANHQPMRVHALTNRRRDSRQQGINALAGIHKSEIAH